MRRGARGAAVRDAGRRGGRGTWSGGGLVAIGRGTGLVGEAVVMLGVLVMGKEGYERGGAG